MPTVRLNVEAPSNKGLTVSTFQKSPFFVEFLLKLFMKFIGHYTLTKIGRE